MAQTRSYIESTVQGQKFLEKLEVHISYAKANDYLTVVLFYKIDRLMSVIIFNLGN